MNFSINENKPAETIYNFVKVFFQDAAPRVVFSGKNADLFIPSIKCIINVDGGEWFGRTTKQCNLENKYFNEIGIPVIWIRQNGKQKLNAFNGAIIDADLNDPVDLFDSIKMLYKFLARFVSVEELKDALMNFDVEITASVKRKIDFDY